MIPAAAPRNSAGNVGPPRKLPSDRPYAKPLNTISHVSAASDHVAGLADQSRELVLTGEQNLVHAVARDLRERDRQPADDQPDRRQEHEHLPA